MNKMKMASVLLMAQMFSSFEENMNKPTNKITGRISEEKLLKEYGLIKKKESTLSANQRKEIVYHVEKYILGVRK